ncbi:DUF2235 domain-containing protein [Rhizobium tumorigenes]|uniref:DUF2235 domain-containing protein n=1 Tax=Rhizobium tumorigenes TaxID=2041385 RepID=UPI00241FF2F0|nr:DUF2235 domain-containing protein [Rhizobium tumorigenes]WFR99631.1 DUF2235 domain-containing protein [Rhizobium tumorigenes]
MLSLFDGTSNEISNDVTDILRLLRTLEHSARQIVRYDPALVPSETTAGDKRWIDEKRTMSEYWKTRGIS